MAEFAFVAMINAVSFVLGGVGTSVIINVFGVKLVVQSLIFIIAVAYFIGAIFGEDNPGYDPNLLTRK